MLRAVRRSMMRRVVIAAFMTILAFGPVVGALAKDNISTLRSGHGHGSLRLGSVVAKDNISTL